MNIKLKIPLCSEDRVKEVSIEPTYDLTTESDKRMAWLGKRFARFLNETPSVFMDGLKKELARLNSPAVVDKRVKEMNDYFAGKKKKPDYDKRYRYVIRFNGIKDSPEYRTKGKAEEMAKKAIARGKEVIWIFKVDARNGSCVKVVKSY